MSQVDDQKKERLVLITYAAYLASIVVPFFALIGLTLNIFYIKSIRATWLESHFKLQLQTAMICIVVGVVSFLLVFKSIPIGMGLLVASEIYFFLSVSYGFFLFWKQQPAKTINLIRWK